jgi:hypothetical protein
MRSNSTVNSRWRSRRGLMRDHLSRSSRSGYSLIDNIVSAYHRHCPKRRPSVSQAILLFGPAFYCFGRSPVEEADGVERRVTTRAPSTRTYRFNLVLLKKLELANLAQILWSYLECFVQASVWLPRSTSTLKMPPELSRRGVERITGRDVSLL